MLKESGASSRPDRIEDPFRHACCPVFDINRHVDGACLWIFQLSPWPSERAYWPAFRGSADRQNSGTASTDTSPATVVRGAVAKAIEELDLDAAFIEAGVRSRRGRIARSGAARWPTAF